MPTEEQIHHVVSALVHLEKQSPGNHPSVKAIAKQAGLTNGTAWNHLHAAADQGYIVQREGKFMSLAFAKAVDKQLKEVIEK